MSNEFSFDLGAMGPMLNAMMSRYGQYMDLGLQQAQEEMPRQRRAFDLYERGQEEELRTSREARKGRKKAAGEAKRLEKKSDAEKKRQEALDYAEKERARQAVNFVPATGRGMAGGFRGGVSTRPGGQMMDPVTRQLMTSVATGTLQR